MSSFPSRRRLFALITVATATFLLLLIAEAASRLVLLARYSREAISGMPTTRDDRYSSVYDELLGWKRRPGRRVGRHANLAETNSQGFRATRDYATAVPSGRYRILCVGDSFTQGVGEDNETFPAQLEALSPVIEAVNMGRAGYGIDQMYLFYKRDGMLLQANLLMFAFIEDDFQRMPYETFYLRPKPQLLVRGNTLVISNVPVPKRDTFPTNTALFKLLHRAREKLANQYDIFPVVELVFDDLKALTRERHQELVLVYLPSQVDSPGSDRPPRDMVSRVEKIAKDKEIHFWNLTSMFRGIPPSDVATYFVPDGHYSARGNHLAATTLLGELRKQFPEVPF
jgi:hypothetical protein